MINSMKKNICIVCNNKEPILFGKKNNWNRWQCIQCKHVWVFPLPKNTKEIYQKDYFSGAHAGFGYVDYDRDKEPMNATFKKVLTKIESLSKKKGILLDIGAATGFFMDIARSRGWDTKGTEIAKYATLIAKKKGLEVICSDITKANFPAESFDVITLWDVLEHLASPQKEVKKVVKFLKPGGIVFINTPDMDSLLGRVLKTRWHMMGPPEHLHYFNKNNIKIFLKDNGLSIISIGTISKRFSCKYLLQVLNNSYGIKWAGIIAQWANAHPQIGNLSLPINLYDNMAVYARKER